MIIEDNPADLKLMVAVLNAGGYIVSERANAIGALDQISAEKPDAIVLNLALLQMDGLAFIRELAAATGVCDIPVLAVTAYPERFTTSELEEAGFRGWLIKPLDTRSLAAQVERAVHVRKHREAFP